MKKPAFALACLCLALPLALFAEGLPADPGAEARAFLRLFFDKNPGFSANFTEAMKKAFGPSAAVAAADQLSTRAGAFRAFGSTKSEAKGAYLVVTQRGEYKHGAFDFVVTFDSQGRIAGFFIQNPAPPPAAWKLPLYADSKTYREEAAQVDAGGWPLGATLSLPLAGGPFPALVLVHGSGPNDRDESIGPNKIFGDLAAGLSSRGLAVLRYDKRTKVYAARLAESGASLGVDEETVEDAVAALALLAGDGRIDGRRIYLVGHSLGAMLGPRIAEKAKARGLELAGLVLIAPNARPLEDIIYDQVVYLARLDGSLSEEEKSSIVALEIAVGRVKKLNPSSGVEDPGPGDLPLGIPAAYWRSLAGYDPVARAAALPQPILVIHGKRDYQVMPGEAELWKKGLAGKKNAKTLLLPDLDHLMLKGSGPPSPAEYEIASHVDKGVLEAVSAFILRGGR